MLWTVYVFVCYYAPYLQFFHAHLIPDLYIYVCPKVQLSHVPPVYARLCGHIHEWLYYWVVIVPELPQILFVFWRYC